MRLQIAVMKACNICWFAFGIYNACMKRNVRKDQKKKLPNDCNLIRS